MTSYMNMNRAHLRTEVEAPALPVRLGGELGADLLVTVEGDVVDDKRAFLAHRVDGQRTGGRALHEVRVSERPLGT